MDRDRKNKKIRIAIVGSRDYVDTHKISTFIRNVYSKYKYATIVSGGAKGPDKIAVGEAEKIGMKTMVFPAQWIDSNGNTDMSAGVKRNTTIVENSDVVVAFWNGKSNGTKDTIRKAIKNGKKVIIYPDCDSSFLTL